MSEKASKLKRIHTRLRAWLRAAMPYTMAFAAIGVAVIIGVRYLTPPPASFQQEAVVVAINDDGASSENFFQLPTERGEWEKFCIQKAPHYRKTVYVDYNFSSDGLLGKAGWCALSTDREGNYTYFGHPLDWAESDGNKNITNGSGEFFADVPSGGVGGERNWSRPKTKLGTCKEELYNLLKGYQWNYERVIEDFQDSLHRCIVWAAEHKAGKERELKQFWTNEFRDLFGVSLYINPNAKPPQDAGASPPVPQASPPKNTGNTDAKAAKGTIATDIVVPRHQCPSLYYPTILTDASGNITRVCTPHSEAEKMVGVTEEDK